MDKEEYSDISSSDGIEINHLENYITSIQKNLFDIDLICELIEYLEKYQHFEIAYNLAKLSLKKYPNNGILRDIYEMMAPYENPTLLNCLHNLWLTTNTYDVYPSQIKYRNLVPEDELVNLDAMIHFSKKIVSLSDTLFIIPPKTEFKISRTFYFEKFKMYLLRCKCTWNSKNKINA